MPRVRMRDITTLGASIIEASGAAPAPCKNCGLNEKWKAARPIMQVFDLDMQTTQRPMLEGRDAERAAAFGAVFELSGLNEVSVANPAEFMTRATNMAGVCILGLQVLDTAKRKQALVDLGGDVWAQGVLDLAANVGIPKLEDCIRFSLALHFLIGIIQAESDTSSIYSIAYVKTKNTYDRITPAPLTKEQGAPYVARAFSEDKAREWAAKVGYVDSGDLKGLSNLDALQHPYQAAEAHNVGGIASSLGLGSLDGLGFLDFIGDALSTIGGAIVSAGKAVVGFVVDVVKVVGGFMLDAVGKILNFTGDIICQGLKWLLGDTVGGIICSIFSTFAQILKYTLTSLFEVAKAVGKGLVGMVKALIDGNPKKAGMVLLTEITAILFLLPPLGPMLATILGVDMATLGDMGRRVAQKAPTFIIGVASSIFNMLSLTPQAVVAFIEALRPAIEVFAGAALFSADGGKMPLESYETAMGSLVSYCTGIMLKVINVTTTCTKLANEIASTDIEYAAADILEGKFKTIIDAMKRLNFKDIVAGILNLGSTPGIKAKRLAAGAEDPKKIIAAAAVKDQLDILNDRLKTLDPHSLAPILYAGTSRMDAADSETLFFATLKNLPPDQQLVFLSRLADRGVVLPNATGFPDAPGLPSAIVAGFGLWPLVLGGAGLLTIGGLLLRRRA